MRILGWKSWEKWIDNIDNEVAKEVGELTHKKAYEVEREAKGLAPVDTGRLKGSITTTVKGKGSKVKAEIGTDVEYASSVEFGTYKQKAQPFLMPAFESVASEFHEEIQAIFEEELN